MLGCGEMPDWHLAAPIIAQSFCGIILRPFTNGLCDTKAGGRNDDDTAQLKYGVPT